MTDHKNYLRTNLKSNFDNQLMKFDLSHKTHLALLDELVKTAMFVVDCMMERCGSCGHPPEFHGARDGTVSHGTASARSTSSPSSPRTSSE